MEGGECPKGKPSTPSLSLLSRNCCCRRTPGCRQKRCDLSCIVIATGRIAVYYTGCDCISKVTVRLRKRFENSPLHQAPDGGRRLSSKYRHSLYAQGIPCCSIRTPVHTSLNVEVQHRRVITPQSPLVRSKNSNVDRQTPT